MKLIDALKILRGPARDSTAAPLRVFLACGFEPLHLQTFLAAHLRQNSPRAVDVQVGLYGDILGSIERLAASDIDAGVVVFEWSDFDPRLGWRTLGGWSPSALPDILQSAQRHMQRLEAALTRAAERVPLAVSLPTLALPPVAFGRGWEASAWELELRRALAEFAANIAANPRVRIVSESRLNQLSAPAERHDLKAELKAGFPYLIAHTSVLAEMLARAVAPAPPKKGVITDLDDTFWHGLVGEVGAEGVHWNLDGGSHAHALYQQLLASLADAGILVAIASKNDPALAGPALKRDDVLLASDKVFPVEINWQAKSESVTRILRTWNIGAQDAIFIDDSPLELAEVQSAHPAITTLQFPSSDTEVAAFLSQLRDLCGKRALAGEDALRLESLRSNAVFAEQSQTSGDDFLATLDAEVEFAPVDSANTRALELVNKTNQWNLNGRRWDESAWQKRLADENAFTVSVAYRDKFGPLGAIAVASGTVENGTIHLDTWVMSCRAFARRIEHRTLETLFESFDAREIRFEFVATEKNGPLREFLETLNATETLAREHFSTACPPLYHRTKGTL